MTATTRKIHPDNVTEIVDNPVLWAAYAGEIAANRTARDAGLTPLVKLGQGGYERIIYGKDGRPLIRFPGDAT